MPYLESEYDDLDKYKNDFGIIIYYKKNTKIISNPYGPACIGKDGYKEYWINDTELTKEEFEKHPDRLKFLGKDYLICLK